MLRTIETTTPAPSPVNLFPAALRVGKKRRGEDGMVGMTSWGQLKMP